MKILLVISEAPPVKSGISRLAEWLIKGLPRYGHQVHTLSYQDIGCLQRHELRLTTMLLHIPRLRRRIADYDMVHLHGPAPTFSDVFLLGCGWGRGERPRLIYTHHYPIALPGLGLPCRLCNWLTMKWANLADHVTATTPSYARIISRHVPPRRVSVVPSGVDYDRFAGPWQKADTYTILFVGQMRATKGLQVLLRAFQGIEGARLDIVGTSQAEPKYRKLARDLRLRNVTFHGQVSDERLAALYGRAHVLVLPAITPGEAFGVVQLEAMAAGCVSVASHLPGVVDVAGDVGFTFPPGDVKALRRLLIYLRDHPEVRAEHARRGPDWARRFTWDHTVRLYEGLYRHVLSPTSHFRSPRPFTFPNVEEGT